MSTKKSAEFQALKTKVMIRSFSLALVGILSVLVSIQLMGYKLDMTKGTVQLTGWLGVLAALSLVFDKQSYLPFLGETVLPPSVLEDSQPRAAAFHVDVRVPRGASHVMYWASESAGGIVPNPWDAYGEYSNAGVVKVSRDGSATLAVRCPALYRVRGKTLPRHVHYRAVFPSGIASAVQTVNVTCL